jgi:chromosomal replication initiation ATPase DnaA
MTITHPKIKKLLSKWEQELREKTGNELILLISFLPDRKDIPFKVIRKVVCKYTGVSYKKAIVVCRERELALTRHLIAYFSKKYTKLSLQQIATLVNKENHTTIMSSVRRISNLLTTGDPIICDAVVKINAAITATYKKQEHETQPG